MGEGNRRDALEGTARCWSVTLTPWPNAVPLNEPCKISVIDSSPRSQIFPSSFLVLCCRWTRAVARAAVGGGERRRHCSELTKHRWRGLSSQSAGGPAGEPAHGSEPGWGSPGSFLFSKIYYNGGISVASTGAGKPATASPPHPAPCYPAGLAGRFLSIEEKGLKAWF